MPQGHERTGFGFGVQQDFGRQYTGHHRHTANTASRAFVSDRSLLGEARPGQDVPRCRLGRDVRGVKGLSPQAYKPVSFAVLRSSQARSCSTMTVNRACR